MYSFIIHKLNATFKIKVLIALLKFIKQARQIDRAKVCANTILLAK